MERPLRGRGAMLFDGSESRDRTHTVCSVPSRLKRRAVGDCSSGKLIMSCRESSSGVFDAPRDFRYIGLAHGTRTVSPIRTAIRIAVEKIAAAQRDIDVLLQKVDRPIPKAANPFRSGDIRAARIRRHERPVRAIEQLGPKVSFERDTFWLTVASGVRCRMVGIRPAERPADVLLEQDKPLERISVRVMKRFGAPVS